MIRVLHGDAPPTLRVERMALTACGDGVGLLRARIGSRLVIALGVPRRSLDDTTPTWVEQRSGRWMGVGDSYADLDALVVALGGLPDTSASVPARAGGLRPALG